MSLRETIRSLNEHKEVNKPIKGNKSRPTRSERIDPEVSDRGEEKSHAAGPPRRAAKACALGVSSGTSGVREGSRRALQCADRLSRAGRASKGTDGARDPPGAPGSGCGAPGRPSGEEGAEQLGETRAAQSGRFGPPRRTGNPEREAQAVRREGRCSPAARGSDPHRAAGPAGRPRAGARVALPLEAPCAAKQRAAGLLGLILTATAALAILALVTYDPRDPLFRFAEVANGAGVVGAALAGTLRWAVGSGGGAVLVAAVTVLGLRLLCSASRPALLVGYDGVAARRHHGTRAAASRRGGGGRGLAGFPGGGNGRGGGCGLGGAASRWLARRPTGGFGGALAEPGGAPWCSTGCSPWAAPSRCCRPVWGGRAGGVGTKGLAGGPRRGRGARRGAGADRRTPPPRRRASAGGRGGAGVGARHHRSPRRGPGAAPPPAPFNPRRANASYAHPTLAIFRRPPHSARPADRTACSTTPGSSRRSSPTSASSGRS